MTSETEYTHLRAFESDYDKAQAQVRQAASVWVLAGFAALGYVLSHPLPLPNGLTQPLFGALVCCGSAFGLIILWIIDQRVYQRLLHSVFVQGLFLEWKSQSTTEPLPLIRTKMYFDTLNISFKLSLFYIVPVSAFLLIQAYFAFSAGPPIVCSFSGFFAICLLVSHFAALAAMCWFSHADKNLVGQHGGPYPDVFQNYLRNRTYATDLKKWLAK